MTDDNETEGSKDLSLQAQAPYGRQSLPLKEAVQPVAP